MGSGPTEREKLTSTHSVESKLKCVTVFKFIGKFDEPIFLPQIKGNMIKDTANFT